MANYAVEMLHITKRFPGIIANDDITLQLRRGEIHALLGENGAGKSTLMSVLFGLYQPEEGEIHKDGKKVQGNKPVQPVVCPAGQRDDIPRHLNMPCPDEHSLEEAYRWRCEHIQ